MTYKTIAPSYVNYVISNFSKATVVFDSYPDLPSIKDNVTHRKLGKDNSPTIAFTNDMLFHTKRVLFLGNNVNKQKFINLLSIELKKSRCSVIHVKNGGDHQPDVDIAKTAVKSCESYHTTLIGEDTDLLVLLLLFYYDLDAQKLYYRSGKSV